MKGKSKAYVSLGCYVIALVIVWGSYRHIDQAVALSLHQLPFNPLTLYLSVFFTQLGEPMFWAGFSAISILVSIGMRWQQGKWTHLSYLLFSLGVSLVFALLLTQVVKECLGRARPELFLMSGHSYGLYGLSNLSTFNSMPSGHVVAIFTVATVVAKEYRRYAILAFSIAILVALSRLLLNIHYIGDILLGAYIGVQISLVTLATLATFKQQVVHHHKPHHAHHHNNNHHNHK